MSDFCNSAHAEYCAKLANVCRIFCCAQN